MKTFQLLARVVTATRKKTKELAQAKAADLIIILVENSPGALAETHDFCNESDIAPKIYVLAPKAYKRSYSAKGALELLDEGHGGVYWYDNSEIKGYNMKTKDRKTYRSSSSTELHKQVSERRCFNEDAEIHRRGVALQYERPLHSHRKF